MLEMLRARLREIPAVLIPRRLGIALRYYEGPLRNIAAWLVRSREISNFTYDLSDMNREQLAWFVAAVTGAKFEEVVGYLDEILHDEQLREHVQTATQSSEFRYFSDLVPRYARRIGWYAVVRALKPRVVIETGVDKGLGTCVLAAALLRNRAEGHSGMVYGTDILETAGFLVGGPYAEVARLLIGDSIESLRKFSEPIDLFINDSDHSSEYEYNEYRTVQDKLSKRGVVLGDNAHCSPSLMRFARESGRRFLFFQEKPSEHWYPGAGIGAAF